MSCKHCGGDHDNAACSEQTAPTIMQHDMEVQFSHQIVELALRWYGDHEPPSHPTPAGKKWQQFIAKLAQLRDSRKK